MMISDSYIQRAIQQLINGQDLSAADMTAVVQQIMAGKAAPEQIAGFLVALRMKGETVTEMAAAAKVMREFATTIDIQHPHLIDIVGTGGDGAKTFNISTACAFVAAAAGATVAKHGNRSVSSSSGSADVLEAAGINLELHPEQVKTCIETLGIGFLFCPNYHPAAKYAAGPRRAIGIRTVFNLLGPLNNPAQVKRQILGVYDKHWLGPIAEVMRILGSQHVLVVHSQDGLDEISSASPTDVAELRDGNITMYTINPNEYDIHSNDLTDITVDSPQQSLNMIQAVFNNQPGNAKNIVLLNAGAAIYVAGIANNIADGIQQARTVLENGKALEKFNQLQKFS